MNELNGRCAVVTGGASGIGLGIARSLAKRGVRVAIADVEASALEQAVKELQPFGVSVVPLRLDISRRNDVYAAAEEVWATFGRLDILINNAGVAYNAKPLHEAPDDMIDWSFGVNVFGVLNGIKAFVPKIIETGQGGHIVNTSSIGGFQVRKSAIWHQGLYAATKYAVTALSEGLRLDLEAHGIGVSVLAPSAVDTNIAKSDRNRATEFGGPTTGSQSEKVEGMLREVGISPDLVGEQVIESIRTNAEYIFTHLEGLELLKARHRRIEASFEQTRAFALRVNEA